MKQIVFIASYPKSGNTWLRSIITNILHDNTNFSLTNLERINLFSQYKNFKDFSNLTYQENGNLNFDFVVKNWIKAQKLINKKNDKKVFFKTHNIHGLVNGNYFTNEDVCAGYIYIIRDPRDVCISLSHHVGRNYDETIDDMLFNRKRLSTNYRVNEVVSTWRENINSWLLFDNVPRLVIKYEDLLMDSKKHYLKIINFVQKITNNKDNINIKKIIEKTNFENLRKLEKINGFNESRGYNFFFRNGKSNQWKNELKYDQIIKIEKELKIPMNNLGYL